MKEQYYKAIVQTFDGERVFYDIGHVWFWNGKPERITVLDEEGDYYGYKNDEEPFELVEIPERRVLSRRPEDDTKRREIFGRFSKEAREQRGV